MVVLLNSTFYHYCDVDPATVEAFLGADSKGRYNRNSIKLMRPAAVLAARVNRSHAFP